ncbi:Lacal_2735 family protein [Aquimarina sp. ERC-38]|uniref:Lacal_2735 family protein n=1 Tax=Aquimarina sp. ERC-38 TaxID=2949996 RepID=UPI0022468A8E|nr:Lacal_2735 family protein [Aquimarina sp. ERC-38]UZO80308.1 Lacal_2735 family protein [Aquimarina sp. ERC-38]
MLGLFKKRSEKEILEKKYQKLMKESYELSHRNRKASDTKLAEAEALMNQIEQLKVTS